jgi:threonine/homoserine/homoserine lactone efflux protein
MSSLLAEVIPLALGAAISPVLFLLQLNALTGERPIARGAALTAGAALVLIIVSTIGVLIGETSFSTKETLQAWINIGFGALLVLVGLRGLLRQPKTRAPGRNTTHRASIAGAFLAGAGGMASNVTTFALYVPALALIAGSGLPFRQQGIASLVILVITLVVAWVPLVLAATVPGASTRLLPWLGHWMTTNDRWIQVVLGFGFGIWLLLKGVDAL